MPQKNRVFPYVADAFYHIYSRGVNKQPIFWDEKDYQVFRNIVRQKLREPFGDLCLHAFALMENHFHFLIWQRNERDISLFMRSILIKYSMYARKKYGRTGTLFESSFRAVYLDRESVVQEVKKYILLNPVNAGLTSCEHVGVKI